MAEHESQICQRYREASQEKARAILERMDRNDPLWMDRISSPTKKSWFNFTESLIPNFLTQAVSVAVIVCLLISASSARMTVKAVMLTIDAGLQTGQAGAFNR